MIFILNFLLITHEKKTIKTFFIETKNNNLEHESREL
jgi:hypothetical protein